MVPTTKAQRLALKRLFDRGDTQRPGETWREFRRRVRAGFDCVIIVWTGRIIGIEPDGYTFG